VKTDRLDARELVRLYRAGELSFVVPLAGARGRRDLAGRAPDRQPCSEAHFKTLSYRLELPSGFRTSSTFPPSGQPFLMTPAAVHRGQANPLHAERAGVFQE
jgi:hypothetical protein